MNHLCLFFLLREVQKTAAALRVKHIKQCQVFLFPFHLTSLLCPPSLHLAVSTEKAHLSFKLLLGDLSRTSWQRELQDIFQTIQFLLTDDFSVCTEAKGQ